MTVTNYILNVNFWQPKPTTAVTRERKRLAFAGAFIMKNFFDTYLRPPLQIFHRKDVAAAKLKLFNQTAQFQFFKHENILQTAIA